MVFAAGAAAALAGSAASSLEGQPLATRSGPRGATLFATLAPAATGIVVENRYDDPRMWGARFQEFVYGAIGTGVAIGDFDGDGRPDVYVVSKTEGGRLFRNLGGWRFEDVTERAGVSGTTTGWAETAKSWIGLGDTSVPWFQGATFADVDNDGRLDLYVCRFGQPNLLFMNQGDGTFKEEAAARGLAVSDASGVGAFCDYDRDGWLDVYLQTNLLDVAKQPEGQRDRLFRNNGDGKFTEVTDRAGIRGDTQGHSAIWWDFDNDGWPDLYVANDFAAPDSLYRNNRDGTFTDVINSVVPLMPHSSMGADLGDVNNDGRIDFLVADMAATSHEKDQRGMATNRSRLDEMREPPGVAPQYMRNTLFLNTGTGRVLEAAYLAGLEASDWTWSVRLEDLDNDGRLDAFFTNGMVRELNNVDLVARSSAAGSLVEKARVMKASPPLAQANLVFRNLGDLSFEDASRAWGLDRTGVSFGAAFGDLDGDGDLDLVFVNYEGGVSVLRNDSDTGHRVIVALNGRAIPTETLSLPAVSLSNPSKSTRSNRFGVSATVRVESASGVQVRQLGVARGYLSSSEPVLHFGLGDDSRIERLVVEWPSGATQTFTDVPVDRKLTITEPDSATAGLRRNEPDSATDRVNAELQTRIDSAEGNSGFGVPPLGGPGPAATESSPPMFSPTPPPPSFAPADPTRASADFNRDGLPDRFVGGSALPGQYPLAGPSTLLAGRSDLEDVTDTLAPGLRDVGLVTAAIWSDVDVDGWPDLVIAVDWGAVRYFHNNAGRGFEDWTERAGFSSAGTGRWSALASADFNGDGRPDFVVGNLGLNTRYRASAQEPALLFFGDFGGGSEAAIEGHFEEGVLYPWLSRGEMEAKVAVVRRRFPRNDSYARAPLVEIVGEDRLAAARRFAVTELRSGILLSQPDGSHRFEPLPRIAQIAPIRGVVADDFDGDAAADIYAVQNSFEPPPSIGHFGGGLSQLLRGDGSGGFTAVPPAESGLIVPGEAVAVIARDLDGDDRPDFVITRGDGSTIAFRNNGASQGEATRSDATK